MITILKLKLTQLIIRRAAQGNAQIRLDIKQKFVLKLLAINNTKLILSNDYDSA